MSIDLRPGAEALEAPKAVPGAETVASHWMAVSTALTQTQAVQNASIPPEAWTGAAADAASNEIQVLGHKLADLAEVFPDPAQGLKTWKSQVDQAIQVINGLQQQWDEAVATYNKAIAAISSRRMTEDNFHPEIEEKKARATLEGAQRPLKKSYEDQLHQLNEAASQKADSIKAAADSKISPEAVKRGRDAVGAELLGTDMSIAHAAASWAEAQADAPRMAADLEKAANSFGPLSEEDVKKLEERWGDKLRNPYYVQAMADAYRSAHRGTGDYSDMLNRLSIKTAGLSTNSESGAALRNSFIDRIGTAMVLSTGGVDASQDQLANSASYQQAKNALRGRSGMTISQIEHANIESFKATGNKLYEFGPGAPHFRGYQVFSQATALAGIRNSNLAFGREVYEGGNDSLAAEMVRYDHDFHSSVPLKGPEEGYKSLIRWTREDGYARTLAMDPLQSLYQLSDTPESLKHEGAPASLRNEEVLRLSQLRGFLDTDSGYPAYHSSQGKIGVVTFARYLTGNRHPESVVNVGELDAGEALGDMLHDASDPQGLGPAEPQRDGYGAGAEGDSDYDKAHKEWVEERRKRASIAANTMAGYQDGLDYNHKTGLVNTDQVDGQDIFGYRNHALRSWMGSIIEPYVYDLASEMHFSTGQGMRADGGLGEYDSVHMKFSGPLVDRFKQPGGLLQDLAFDRPKVINDGGTQDNLLDDQYEGGRKPALQVVQAAAYRGYMSDVTEALQRTDHQSRTDGVEGAINRWTELIQETFDANPDKDTAIAKALDESHRNARKIVEFIVDESAGYAVKQVPVAGPIAKAAIKGASGAFLDGIVPTDNEPKAWTSHYDANREARHLMQDGLLVAMYNSDHWTEHAGKDDVSPGTQAYADKKLPALKSDGTRRDFWSLEPSEREQVLTYFTGKDSDFRRFFDADYNAQQNAQDDGRVEKPSSRGK